jgi:hypothetical protein
VAIVRPVTAARPTTTAHPAAPRLVTVHTNFDLEAGDTSQVRLKDPPAQFDDKGLIKKYTRAELKQLKGEHPELPGYPGDYTNLKNGQTVIVYFKRNNALAAKAAPEVDSAAESEQPKKKKKTAMSAAGVLGGVVTKLEGSTRKFTLRVDTQTQAGKQPTIDPKTMLQDFHVSMIVILKD